jgi:hypothetical protein
MIHCPARFESFSFEQGFSEHSIVSRIDLQETLKMNSRSSVERFEADRFFTKHTPFGTRRCSAASAPQREPSKMRRPSFRHATFFSGFPLSGKTTGLVTQSIGIAKALPVVATFDFCDGDGASGDVGPPQAIITMVDAAPGSTISEAMACPVACEDADERPRIELLVDQVAFAGGIALTTPPGPLTTARLSGDSR